MNENVRQICVFSVTDTNSYRREGQNFKYICKCTVWKIWISKNLDYFVCEGLTYPSIKVVDWTITEDFEGASLELIVPDVLQETLYDLYSVGPWKPHENIRIRE